MSSKRTHEGQRGSVTIEMVIIFPALLLMVFGAVQGGLYYHARNSAITAAQHGAREAALYDSSAAEGEAAAMSLLTASAATNPRVTVNRTDTTVTAIVQVDSPNLLPWLISDMQIQQTASMPTERVT